MIHALRFEDPAEFRVRVAPFLLADEAMHTLPLGLVTRLATLGPAEDHDPYLMLAEDDGLVVAVMLRMAARFPLVVSRIVQDHALAPIVDAAAALDPPAIGVAGPKPWVERLAARLALGSVSHRGWSWHNAPSASTKSNLPRVLLAPCGL